MKLQPIEAELNNDGYGTFYHHGRLVVTKFLMGSTPSALLMGPIECWVYFENNQYIVMHAQDGNIPTIETFSAKSDALAFIRNRFPL